MTLQGWISVSFRRGKREGCTTGGREICTSSPSTESTSVQMASKGVARMYTTAGGGRRAECSGSLLNNETEDGALYFLTAWHCAKPPPGLGFMDPAMETTRPYLATEFEFLADQCNTTSAYVIGKGSRFVAGNMRGDWGLLRIEGELELAGSMTTENAVVGFLGWDSSSRDNFKGYVVHHEGGNDQRLATFNAEGLSFFSRGSFGSCTGPECSHFDVSFNGFNPYVGASGSPGFPDKTAQVVGVYTHGELVPGCAGSFSRFSQMYQDGRVRGALMYGNDYFEGTGVAQDFDDSQRPVYSRFSCEGGGEDLKTAEGTGIAGDPYQLTKLCQLQDMDSDRNAHYRLASDIDAENSRLMNNVEDNPNSIGLGFKPVGGSTTLSALIETNGGMVQFREGSTLKISELAFAGSFDGAGFEIRNLKIARPAEDFVGLFSIVSIQSRLQRINFPGLSVTGQDAVGAVAGAALGGSIAGFLSRDISVEGRNLVGGVTGYKYAGNIEGVDISGRVIGRAASSTYIGGVVGYNHSGNIENVLVLRPTNVSGGSNLGGIAGYHGIGDIQNVTVNARVVARGNDVGGLVGHKDSGNIRRAYLGAMEVRGRRSVGGAVGYQLSGSLEDVFSLNLDIVVNGEVNVGGLVGLNRASILRSQVVAEVQGTTRVGGLVGGQCSGGEISQSFAGGVVGVSTTRGSHFGGLVGHNQSTIRDSYAISSVSASTTVGGLVGRNEGSIQQSYAASTVRGASNVGALAGSNVKGGVIEDSYALPVMPVLGSTISQLVGRDGGKTTRSTVLSLEQLSCASTPGETCQGEESYSGWSTQTWDFGDQNTLPKIRGLIFSASLIGKLLGSDVSETNQFTVCMLPEESTLEMTVEAQQGVRLDDLEWKLRSPPALMTTVFFVVNGDDEDASTLTAGTTEVLVQFERSTGVSYSDFMLSLEDSSGGLRDQLTVKMQELASPPTIYFSSPETEIGDGTTRAMIELYIGARPTTATIQLYIVEEEEFPCDGGVTWSLVRSTPTDISPLMFLPINNSERVSVDLPLSAGLRQAMFTIRVESAARKGKFGNEVTVKVFRRNFLVRLKALLGGAVR